MNLTCLVLSLLLPEGPTYHRCSLRPRQVSGPSGSLGLLAVLPSRPGSQDPCSTLKNQEADLLFCPWTLPSLPPTLVPGALLDWSLFSSGDLLIIMAQIIIAIQMVLEEKFVYKHNIHPLQAVGIEGACGHRPGSSGWREGSTGAVCAVTHKSGLVT